MTTQLPGKVILGANPAAAASQAARLVAQALAAAIGARGAASLALSGGTTPKPAYEQLALEPGVDWSRVSVFWIDERAVPPTNDRSNYKLAKGSLLDRAPILAANVHRMLGEAPELAAAARAYEGVLGALLDGVQVGELFIPLFDVAVLGIGDDSHTASLFPGESAVDLHDRVALPIPASAARGTEARLTVTAPVLQHIRAAFLLANGKAKREPLKRVAAETGTLRETPSRLYRQSKGELTWILDESAGA